MREEAGGSVSERIERFMKFVGRRITINRARLARARNRHARIVAVTGSSGKTTVCLMLEHILSDIGPTAARISQNTMPAIAPFIRNLDREVDFAVVETAIGALDQMKHLAKLLRPHIAVVTMIELEHKKELQDVETVAREKGYLVEHMAPTGVAILNADDDKTEELAERAAGRVVTFGRSAGADVRAVNVSAAYPDRLSLTIEASGLELGLQTKLVGEHFWLPVTAAVSVALQLGVSPDVISRRIASFEPAVGRCSVRVLSDDRHFVMDTYKAPQHSLVQAFEVAGAARASRRRIVLGQLSDTTGGGSTAYRRAYRLARDYADQVILVGGSAHRHNAPQEDIDSGRVVDFGTVREVADYLQQTATPGELVLLKSSCSLHLERAALAQDETVECWGQICKLKTDCSRCGLYGMAYETHLGDRSALTGSGGGR